MEKSLRTPAQDALLNLLRAKRKALGINQADVGSRLDQYQSFVSKYEKGQRRLDVIEFCAIARALDQHPAELLRELVDAADL